MDQVYIYGVLAAVVLGLLTITFTRDDECNIQHLGCVAVVLLLSVLSWVTVILAILTEIHEARKTKP